MLQTPRKACIAGVDVVELLTYDLRMTSSTASRIQLTVETALIGTIVYKGNGSTQWVIAGGHTYPTGQFVVSLVKASSVKELRVGA